MNTRHNLTLEVNVKKNTETTDCLKQMYLSFV